MRALARPLALPLLLLALTTPANAATITLNAPTAAITLPDGDDYATTVLGDPCDFDKRRDLLYDQALDGVAVTDGIWHATARGDGGPAVAPVFQGFAGSLTAIHLDMPEYGTNRPVDASRYRELSYRIDSNTRRFLNLFWTRNTDLPLPCGQFDSGCNPEAGSGLIDDADFLPAAIVPRSGWGIYDLRLDDPATFAQQHGHTWSGAVTGLMIAPISGDAGAPLAFDWIRLVDPSTSPTLTVTWSTAGAPGDATVQIWADGSGGCGGDIVAHQVPNTGSYVLHTAMLPPGTWRFHVELVHPSASLTSLDSLAGSACSGPVTIVQAPVLRFTAPSVDSGADYASEALGNPWDMNGPDDIANADDDPAARGWKDPTFDGGIFHATAIAPGRSSPWSDASLLMSGPALVPIETDRYRYLTFRLWNDTSHFRDTIDYQTRGGGLRAIFSDLGLGADGTDGTPVLLYEDWHEYAIDLWSMPGDPTDHGVPNPGWLGTGLVSRLQIDPTEVQVSSDFAFDDIALRAETCADGAFTATWSLALATAGATVDLFADADTTPGGEIHLAGPVPAAAGAGSLGVDVSALGSGRWWLEARVDDGVQQRVAYSRVPLVVPCLPPANATAPFVPQTGSWSTPRDRQFRATGPSIGTFPDVTGTALRASAQVSGPTRRTRVVAVYGWRGPSDYSFVEVDARRGRVIAFRLSGGRRKKVKLVRYWRAKAVRSGPMPLVLHVDAGHVQLSIDGQLALELRGADTSGLVGFGTVRRGIVDITNPRADALGS